MFSFRETPNKETLQATFERRSCFSNDQKNVSIQEPNDQGEDDSEINDLISVNECGVFNVKLNPKQVEDDKTINLSRAKKNNIFK